MSTHAESAISALKFGITAVERLTSEARRGNHIAAIALVDLANTATRAAHDLWLDDNSESPDPAPNEKEASRFARDLALRRKCIRQHVRTHQYFPTLEPFPVGHLRKEAARRFTLKQNEILGELRFGSLKKKGRQTNHRSMFHLVYNVIELAFWRIQISPTRFAKRNPLERKIFLLPDLSRKSYMKWVTTAVEWIKANRWEELKDPETNLNRLSKAYAAVGKHQQKKIAALPGKRELAARGTTVDDASFNEREERAKIRQMTPSDKVLLSGLKGEMQRWLKRNID